MQNTQIVFSHVLEASVSMENKSGIFLTRLCGLMARMTLNKEINSNIMGLISLFRIRADHRVWRTWGHIGKFHSQQFSFKSRNESEILQQDFGKKHYLQLHIIAFSLGFAMNNLFWRRTNFANFQKWRTNFVKFAGFFAIDLLFVRKLIANNFCQKKAL